MHSRALIRPGRPRLSMLGLLALVAFALPARADNPPGAPAGQYDFFDQLSFQIKDVKTGLRWTRSVSAEAIPFSTAKTVCTGASRLPTLKELLTLVDEQPHPDYDQKLQRTVTKMIDPNAFDRDMPVDRSYWSSSFADEGTMWTVDFSNGRTTAVATFDARYVRCVTYVP